MPTTKDSIDIGNLPNDLKGHVQNIYKSAQYIEQNFQSPDWKNSVDDPQMLQSGHQFAQDIMKVCEKYQEPLAIDFSSLVGSGSGPGSGTSGSGGSGGTRRT